MLGILKDLKLPIENNSIKLGALYFLFNSKLEIVLVGEYDHADIESLDLEKMITLRRYLDHKIMKIKVNKLTTEPF